MWYVISFLSGVLITMIFIEVKTGIFSNWLVTKIDQWAETIKRKISKK